MLLNEGVNEKGARAGTRASGRQVSCPSGQIRSWARGLTRGRGQARARSFHFPLERFARPLALPLPERKM